MASKNVRTARAVQDAFNRRDFDAALKLYGDGATFVDHARGITLKSKGEMRAFMEEWANAFSDGQATDEQIIDAGDTVVIQMVARGTNDGQFGPFPATGRRVSVPFCDVYRFDAKGKIIEDEMYYDQMTFLVQLGHASAPND